MVYKNNRNDYAGLCACDVAFIYVSAFENGLSF